MKKFPLTKPVMSRKPAKKRTSKEHAWHVIDCSTINQLPCTKQSAQTRSLFSHHRTHSVIGYTHLNNRPAQNLHTISAKTVTDLCVEFATQIRPTASRKPQRDQAECKVKLTQNQHSKQRKKPYTQRQLKTAGQDTQSGNVIARIRQQPKQTQTVYGSHPSKRKPRLGKPRQTAPKKPHETRQVQF